MVDTNREQEVPYISADNSELNSEIENPDQEEPQFSVKQAAKKKGLSASSNKIVVVFVVLALILIVAKFDKIKSSFTGQSQGSEFAKVDSKASDGELQDYSVSGSAEAVPEIAEPFSVSGGSVVKHSSAGDEDKSIAKPDVSVVNPSLSSVNTAVAGKIGELVTSIEALTKALNSVNQEVAALKAAQMKNGRLVVDSLQSINQGLSDVKAADKQSEKVLAAAITDLQGFKSGLQADRIKFNLRILHVESYANKKRIIGYSPESPESVVKLYIGERYGLWTLKDVSNGRVYFVHSDGMEHAEVVK